MITVKNLPQVAYLKMTGDMQGLISAGANTRESMGFNKYQPDLPDEITVIKFDHALVIRRDPQTGQPTGQRVHKPLCFTKWYDKSSPLLYQALCCDERLTEVEIKWYRATGEGTQEHYFTHRLIDARIVNIQANMVLATNVSQDYREPEETICIIYNEIEWTHEVAGTSSWDSFRGSLSRSRGPQRKRLLMLPTLLNSFKRSQTIPQVAYLKMTGAVQGLISAGANTRESMGFNKYQQDHPDEITVIRFDHQIMIPQDPQTGLPIGMRVHKPLCFTKRYDKSSPCLYQVLCCGERLTEVEIKSYRTTGEGTQEHYFTYRLRDATIVNIQANMVLATDVSQDYREPEETICIRYNEIECTHEVAGTSSWDGGMLRPLQAPQRKRFLMLPTLLNSFNRLLNSFNSMIKFFCK